MSSFRLSGAVALALVSGAWIGGPSLVLLGGGCVFDKSGVPHHADATVGPDADATVAVCGNGAIEAPEDCDQESLGGQTCVGLGFEGGELACTGACTYDTVGCNDCGNNQREGAEHCDGVDLAGMTCQGLGFDSGSLACWPSCQFDTSGCAGSGCGDGTIDAGEQCDGGNLAGAACTSLGFSGGVLACGPACQFDTTACDTCGDGVQTGMEQCDGADLDGVTCVTLLHDGGNLACTTGCTFDESGCADCGNGVAELGEACDGADLGGADCTTVGHTTGTLACGPTCGLDTSGCSTCGNGAMEASEACDDGPGNSDSIPDACRQDCTLPVCGDGVCDSTDSGTCDADCKVVVFSDDFEGAWPGGWGTGDSDSGSGFDTWASVPSLVAHGGNRCCWCAGDGSAMLTYDNNMVAWASQTLDLSGLTGQTVYFDLWIWVLVSDADDHMEISYNPGSGWLSLEQNITSTSGWEHRSFDISAAAGSSFVEIGFRFTSDGSDSSTHGAYVDDVAVYYVQ